jgi:hypothetical protein
VKLNWYDGGAVPKDLLENYNAILRPKGEHSGNRIDMGNGAIIVGTKQSIYHGDIRPNAPQLVMPADEWFEFRRGGGLPPKTIPRVGVHPATELLQVIKGELPETGSSFEYASKLTEMVLVGAMAVRANKTVEWDPVRMEARGMPEMKLWIKTPVRKGWEYGETLTVAI